MRSVWKGTIAFGLVAIPCKLYSATEDKRVSFNLVHRQCQSRIQLPKWCPTCNRKLDAEELQRVFEVSKGQYVFMEDSDFEKLPLQSLKTVKLLEFVPPEGIDPRIFEKSYFLAPDDLGATPFGLLREAMAKAGLWAVAKLGYRERDHLSLMRPFKDVLLLQTCFYPDELRDATGLASLQQAMVTEQERQMALQLVSALKVEKFDPAKYHDEYRSALYRLIEAKQAGTVLEVEKAAAPTTDLSASLKASIEAILAAKEAEEVKV